MESVHRKRNRKLLFGNKQAMKDKLFAYDFDYITGYFNKGKDWVHNFTQHAREQSGIDELVCN